MTEDLTNMTNDQNDRWTIWQITLPVWQKTLPIWQMTNMTEDLTHMTVDLISMTEDHTNMTDDQYARWPYQYDRSFHQHRPYSLLLHHTTRTQAHIHSGDISGIQTHILNLLIINVFITFKDYFNIILFNGHTYSIHYNERYLLISQFSLPLFGHSPFLHLLHSVLTKNV